MKEASSRSALLKKPVDHEDQRDAAAQEGGTAVDSASRLTIVLDEQLLPLLSLILKLKLAA